VLLKHVQRARVYEIDIHLENLDAILYAFGIRLKNIIFKFENVFIPNLLFYIS
jgi:hypothetical protein